VRGQAVLRHARVVTRPDFTMYQPIAACRPPSTKNADELQRQRPVDLRSRHQNQTSGSRNTKPDQTPSRRWKYSHQKNPLEFVEVSSGGLTLRTRGELVKFVEGLEPLRFVQRRQGAEYGLPLDDRTGRSGVSPGHPATTTIAKYQRAAGRAATPLPGAAPAPRSPPPASMGAGNLRIGAFIGMGGPDQARTGVSLIRKWPSAASAAGGQGVRSPR